MILPVVRTQFADWNWSTALLHHASRSHYPDFRRSSPTVPAAQDYFSGHLGPGYASPADGRLTRTHTEFLQARSKVATELRGCMHEWQVGIYVPTHAHTSTHTHLHTRAEPSTKFC